MISWRTAIPPSVPLSNLTHPASIIFERSGLFIKTLPHPLAWRPHPMRAAFH
jgi:hypothetical protein